MLTFYLSLLDDERQQSFFEQIYIQHRYTMLAAAHAILKDQQLAEDAVHEAFLRIIKNFEKIFEMDCNKIRPYVVIIVKNIAIDMIRKRKRRGESSLEDFDEFLPDDAPAPDQKILEDESRELLVKALQKIRQPYLDIFSLKIVYGFDNRQIASALNLLESTVRVQIHRGRKMLIDLIEEGEVSHGK